MSLTETSISGMSITGMPTTGMSCGYCEIPVTSSTYRPLPEHLLTYLKEKCCSEYDKYTVLCNGCYNKCHEKYMQEFIRERKRQERELLSQQSTLSISECSRRSVLEAVHRNASNVNSISNSSSSSSFAESISAAVAATPKARSFSNYDFKVGSDGSQIIPPASKFKFPNPSGG